jgi:hypothetical protein
MVYGFDCINDKRRFRDETKYDWSVLVKQWLPYILLDSYKVFSGIVVRFVENNSLGEFLVNQNKAPVFFH